MGCCVSSDTATDLPALAGDASIHGASSSATTRRTSREWDVLSSLDWAPRDRLASDPNTVHRPRREELPAAAVSPPGQNELSFDSGSRQHAGHGTPPFSGGSGHVAEQRQQGLLELPPADAGDDLNGASATVLMLSDLLGTPAPLGGSATNTPRAASLSRSDAVLHRSQNPQSPQHQAQQQQSRRPASAASAASSPERASPSYRGASADVLSGGGRNRPGTLAETPRASSASGRRDCVSRGTNNPLRRDSRQAD